MDRRFVIALIAACLAALLPAVAAAQRLPAPHPERVTVDSDGHPMAVWARVPESPRGTILLLHGRTWSSLPDFDLQVPGLQRSVMQSLVDEGFAAYAVDMRGYGETPRDETGWLTPERSALDTTNVVDWLAEQHPDLPPPALVGWSRGGAIAQLVAQSEPDRISALVLFGFLFDPDAQFIDVTLPEKPQRAPNTEASARSDFISPRVTPPAVANAFVAQALDADPVLADLRGDSQFNALSPAEVAVPTLLLFGDRDPGVIPEVAGKFFARLGTPDKQMVVLPGADHAAQLEDTHDAWIAAVVNFVTRPVSRR
jgi:pimeloyl-ACP methyl ester carboxylesterase